MGFYIRKSFKAGPVRLNLSKSGLGLSAGIKGLRVGSGPKGSYVHAGRKGLYYRKYVKSGKINNNINAVREGAYYRQKSGKQKNSDSETGGFLLLLSLIVFGVILYFSIKFFVNNPFILYSIVSVILIILGTFTLANYRNNRLTKKFNRMVDDIFILNTNLIDKDKIDELNDLKNRIYKSDKLKKKAEILEKQVYEALLDKIIDDKEITKDEKYLIDQFELFSSINDEYKKSIKKDIFNKFYLDAISDHYLTNDELKTLKNFVVSLNIDKNEIKNEIFTINQILKSQKLNLPLQPIKSITIQIQKSETAFYNGKAKVLTRKKIKHNGNNKFEYSVKRDGNFVVTDKRLLIVKDGTTTVQLKDVADIDIDLDKNFILISKTTSAKPVILQTEEPIVVGKIIDLLTRTK